MPKGLCRSKSGWVWVLYEDGKKFEIRADQYDAQGYEPPIDSLPECKDGKPDA